MICLKVSFSTTKQGELVIADTGHYLKYTRK